MPSPWLVPIPASEIEPHGHEESVPGRGGKPQSTDRPSLQNFLRFDLTRQTLVERRFREGNLMADAAVEIVFIDDPALSEVPPAE
jgi:hypothetical protein